MGINLSQFWVIREDARDEFHRKKKREKALANTQHKVATLCAQSLVDCFRNSLAENTLQFILSETFKELYKYGVEKSIYDFHKLIIRICFGFFDDGSNGILPTLDYKIYIKDEEGDLEEVEFAYGGIRTHLMDICQDPDNYAELLQTLPQVIEETIEIASDEIIDHLRLIGLKGVSNYDDEISEDQLHGEVKFQIDTRYIFEPEDD